LCSFFGVNIDKNKLAIKYLNVKKCQAEYEKSSEDDDDD
jgi:hypothetical protein